MESDEKASVGLTNERHGRIALGVDFKLENAGHCVQSGQLLRRMVDDASPVTHGSSLSKSPTADTAYRDGVAFTRRYHSLSLSIHTAVGPDGGPIRPNKVRVNADEFSGVLERHLDPGLIALQRQHRSCGSLSTAFVDELS
ncbi:MAG: hypothetical protein DMG15_25700 [Acidobacteria bacterium]|nr:MAG: hypothetical protein DMG15_25700 [Acidobacteriota bacterium]